MKRLDDGLFSVEFGALQTTALAVEMRKCPE